MTQIIIYLVLLYIIYILISKIYHKYYKISENFESIPDKDWLENLFEYRQIITIPERINHVKKFCKSFDIKQTIFNAILKKDISYNNVYNLKLGDIACALSQ